MASYSKEIEQMRLDSYESVTSLFGLATLISTRLGLSNPNVTGDFQFQLGQITCVCDNYNEFVENAYGAENFGFISTQIRIQEEAHAVIYISSIGGTQIRVSTSSRVLLEKFFVELEKQQSGVQNAINGVTQNIIDSVVINGDGNVVANNNSSVEVETKQEGPTIKSFWTGILQNIASNLLWYILTLVAGALIAYVATK